MEMTVSNELRPVLVTRNDEAEPEQALFHGWFVHAWTHGESPLIGGFSAGQETALLAIVEFSSGNIELVYHDRIKFCDSAELISYYAFGGE